MKTIGFVTGNIEAARVCTHTHVHSGILYIGAPRDVVEGAGEVLRAGSSVSQTTQQQIVCEEVETENYPPIRTKIQRLLYI